MESSGGSSASAQEKLYGDLMNAPSLDLAVIQEWLRQEWLQPAALLGLFGLLTGIFRWLIVDLKDEIRAGEARLKEEIRASEVRQKEAIMEVSQKVDASEARLEKRIDAVSTDSKAIGEKADRLMEALLPTLTKA